MRQLRRWKRLWRRLLTRSHNRTSMGRSRSCWIGKKVHCSQKRLLRRGLEFHVCIINKSAHTKKSLETYLMILVPRTPLSLSLSLSLSIYLSVYVCVSVCLSVYVCVEVFTKPSTRARYDIMSLFKSEFNRLEFSFPSPRPVAIPRLKRPVCPKGISPLRNASKLIFLQLISQYFSKQYLTHLNICIILSNHHFCMNY